MNNVEFRICDCGVVPAHGHIVVDGTEFLPLPILSVSMAKIMLLDTALDLGVINKETSDKVTNLIVASGLPDTADQRTEDGIASAKEDGSSHYLSMIFELFLHGLR